jgi:hypothetical protein
VFNETVVELRCSTSQFPTPDGVRVGDSAIKVQSTYGLGEAEIPPSYWNYTPGVNDAIRGGRVHLVYHQPDSTHYLIFAIVDLRVEEIILNDWWYQPATDPDVPLGE